MRGHTLSLSLSLPSFPNIYKHRSLKKLREPRRQGEKNKKRQGVEERKERRRRRRKGEREKKHWKTVAAKSGRPVDVVNLAVDAFRFGKRRWPIYDRPGRDVGRAEVFDGTPKRKRRPAWQTVPAEFLLPRLTFLHFARSLSSSSSSPNTVVEEYSSPSVYLGTSRIRAIDNSGCGVRSLTAVLFTVFHREILEKSVGHLFRRGDKRRCITFQDLVREDILFLCLDESLRRGSVGGDRYFLPFVGTFDPRWKGRGTRVLRS